MFSGCGGVDGHVIALAGLMGEISRKAVALASSWSKVGSRYQVRPAALPIPNPRRHTPPNINAQHRRDNGEGEVEEGAFHL